MITHPEWNFYTSLKTILSFFLFFCLTSESYASSGFHVKAECIYFEPFFNNSFISSPDSNGQNTFKLQPGGPGKKNSFNYSPGLRLSFIYDTPCCFFKEIGFRLTGLTAFHKRKISLASFISALIDSAGSQSEDSQIDRSRLFPGYISSKHNCRYYSSDLWVNFCIFDQDCFHFSVEPGVHYAMIQFSSKTHVYSRSIRVKEHSKSWGVGPQLGFKFDWQPLNTITFQIKVMGGLLLSRASAHFDMDFLDRINPRKLWKFFPFWDTTLSLCKTISFCDYSVDLTIGYEYLSYSNFIDRIQFPSNGSPRRADNVFCNFDFQGPFISLEFDF